MKTILITILSLSSMFTFAQSRISSIDVAEETLSSGFEKQECVKDYKVIYSKICDEGFTIKDPKKHSNGEYSIEIIVQKL